MTVRTDTNHPRHVDRLLQEHFDVQDGRLLMGDCPVDELVQRYGSPLYIYDRAVIRKRVQQLQRAAGRVEVFYSMKANPSQAVIRTLLDEGCGIEIASAGELQQALRAGCAADRILFAGPGKQTDELNQAVAAGIGEIHVESVAEAVRLSKVAVRQQTTVRVSLRINPESSAQGGAMRMGGKAAPFGIDEERLDDALAAIVRLEGLRVGGVHLFTGTQIFDPDVLRTQYRKALDVARRVAAQLPHPLTSIDLGGGLGVPYFDKESPWDLPSLSDVFRQTVVEADGDPLLTSARLIVEPGRFLVGEAGVYVCRVIDVKSSRERRFAITDGGMHHHLAASGNLGQTIKRNYPIAAVTRLNDPPGDPLEVVGPLCTPLDVIGRKVRLPDVNPGDLIGVFQSGAYGRSSSPLGFLSHAAPAEVMVDGGRHALIRHPGATQDYLAGQPTEPQWESS